MHSRVGARLLRAFFCLGEFVLQPRKMALGLDLLTRVLVRKLLDSIDPRSRFDGQPLAPRSDLSELVLQARDAILRFGDLAPHAVFRLALRLFEAGVSLSLQQGEGG